MDISNFQFLNSHQPELASLGRSAENYAYSDSQSAIVKLRCFAELYVGFIYKELNLPTYDCNNFFERLENESFKIAVEQTVIDKLHLIRIKGNKAAHHRGVSVNEALSLIKEAFFLAAWIYASFHKGKMQDLPQYCTPEPVSAEDGLLRADKQRLELVMNKQTAELQCAKDELALAEKIQQEMMDELDKLKSGVNDTRLHSVQHAGHDAVSNYDFEPAVTRQQINMEDVFAEYQLTDGQSELVKRLDSFLASRDDKVFLLKGYAGTGKTFITKGLTEYFRAIGRNYVLAAPTGKASKVIASKTRSQAYTMHKTIYSFKDIVEYRDSDIDGSETYKYYAQIAVNELSADTVYIVDESSMISDIYNEGEFFRCGTGFLLKDFLKFVNLDHNDHHKKVIFIGDDAQLPPVGMNTSPALDPQYLVNNYALNSSAYELTEVVRQKAESGVMHNAAVMRKSLKDNVFNQLDFNLGFSDLSHVEYSDLVAQYLNSCGGRINAESIVIAHSNRSVAEYNKSIREEFFPGKPEVCARDKVMAITNSSAHGFFISNGDFGQVQEVFGKTEVRSITIKRKSKESGEVISTKVPLSFRDVEVGFRDLEGEIHFFKAKIIESLLYSDLPSLSSDENKALYVDFCMRNQGLKRGTQAFKETLFSDPYFNALRLKFGYAITCHKAQGSEWNHVFVKCKTHESQLSASYFRWLYTAITRTANKLYLLDEPHIKLGSGIKVVSDPGLSALSSVQDQPWASLNEPSTTANSELRSIPGNKPDDCTFGIPTDNGFLMWLLSEVKRCINSTGIEIYDIQHQQYQEAYYFTRGSESARINLSYNSKYKITSVVAIQSTELGNDMLELFNLLKGRVFTPTALSPGDNNFEFSETFLNELHERLMLSSSAANIEITSVTQNPYSQRYCFEQAGERVAVDIYYNKKKQFTNCNPVANMCSSSELRDKVFLMMTEGLA